MSTTVHVLGAVVGIPFILLIFLALTADRMRLVLRLAVLLGAGLILWGCWAIAGAWDATYKIWLVSAGVGGLLMAYTAPSRPVWTRLPIDGNAIIGWLFRIQPLAKHGHHAAPRHESKGD